MASALDGIKVVELSTWFAGPTCGMWLGEHGADVVRVEPVEGDPFALCIRQAYYRPSWI